MSEIRREISPFWPEYARLLRLAARYAVKGDSEWVQHLDQLADELPKITDSLATNSHFSQAMVEFVDALTAPVVEAAVGYQFGR